MSRTKVKAPRWSPKPLRRTAPEGLPSLPTGSARANPPRAPEHLKASNHKQSCGAPRGSPGTWMCANQRPLRPAAPAILFGSVRRGACTLFGAASRPAGGSGGDRLLCSRELGKTGRPGVDSVRTGICQDAGGSVSVGSGLISSVARLARGGWPGTFRKGRRWQPV